MSVETHNYFHDILIPIARGQCTGELDRGGYWSSEHGLWVDSNITQIIEQTDIRERKLIERFVPVALTIAELFT